MPDASRLSVPETLLWLADAPMFIDSDAVERFYDAVVAPAFREDETRTLKISKDQKQRLEGTAEAGAGFSVPSFLASFLSLSAKVGGRAAAETEAGNSEGYEVTFKKIETPQRRLLQLAVYYFLEQDDRVIAASLADSGAFDATRIAAVPRSLGFIDVPERTKLVPMAAEFGDGFVETLYDKLRAPNGERPPTYEETPAYWQWYWEKVPAIQGVEVVEEAARKHGRIEWINMRVPIAADGRTLHLHFQPSRAYATGMFAYHLIMRTEGHGIRLVGTLKAGPGMNVLALYEK